MVTENAGEPPVVMTVEEAARYLQIGRGSAYEAARTGELPVIRIGRRILVSRAALRRMLETAPGNRVVSTGVSNAN